MVVRALLLLLVAWVAAVVPAFGKPGFVMTTKRLAVGQTSTLEIQVTGGKPLSVPRIEHGDAVQIDYVGSSPMTIRTQGRLTQIYRFQYRITALQEGTHTVGPAVVEYADGRDERSVTQTVEVGAENEGLTTNFEATVAYAPAEAWEGQVVLYNYGFRSRERPSRTRWVEPEHKGLVAPRDGDRPRREYAIEDPSGPIWIDETSIPYIVTAAGDLTLETAVLQVWWTIERRDPLGILDRTRRETLALGPAPLVAKALPPAPDAFSGLVGDFRLEGTLDKQRLAVGESATWRVSLIGTGALDGFAFTPPEGPGFRVYDGPSATDAVVKDGQYLASNVAELSVVATRAGKVRVPPLELVVFSPSKGDYVRLKTGGTTLQVTPGAGGATEIESFAPDVDASIAEQAPPPDIRGPWALGLARTFWLGPLLPWLLVGSALPGAAALVVRGARAFRKWRSTRKKPDAVVVDPAARLAHLPPERDARLAEIDAAFREALAHREGIAVSALERTSALATLSGEEADEARAIAAAIDRARFADGPTEGLERRVGALVARLLEEAA